MSITTLLVIFSAPMPKSPGGLVVMTSIRKTQVQSPAKTPIFFLFSYTCVTGTGGNQTLFLIDHVLVFMCL